jgi:hypothetical protein
LYRRLRDRFVTTTTTTETSQLLKHMATCGVAKTMTSATEIADTTITYYAVS